MPFVAIKVNPAELRMIRESLQELVGLYRAQLLADGYLAPPRERVATTVADVSAPTGPEIWKKLEEQKKQERQAEQLAGSKPPVWTDSSYQLQANENNMTHSLGLRVHDVPLLPEQSDLP